MFTDLHQHVRARRLRQENCALDHAISADEEKGCFSDGLSEEQLNLLAKIPQLKVAARTSAFRFKDSDATIGKIAKQLNVAHVLRMRARSNFNRAAKHCPIIVPASRWC